jgi:hypothetical protein
MKILLSNRSLTFWAGSETWVATMAKELAKNHLVHIYTGRNNLLKEYGEYDENIDYDIALINHNSCLKELKDKPNIRKKVYTSHGIMPGPEQPILGADRYVSISEEVQSSTQKMHVTTNRIKQNPVGDFLYLENTIKAAYIWNGQGKLIAKFENSARFNVEDLMPGVYHINFINTDGSTGADRFVKQ